MRTITLKLLRWGTGIGLFAVAILIATHIPDSGPSVLAMGAAIFAVALICLSTLAFFPEARWLILRPLEWMVDQVYLPGGKQGKVVLSYNLPRYYRKCRRFPEALERYEIILDHYPDEERAWREIIELLAIDMGNWEDAERRKDQALRRFGDAGAARSALLKHWEQVQERRPPAQALGSQSAASIPASSAARTSRKG